MTETPAETRNREHMERVRAVHRRSAYERTLEHIRRLEQIRLLSETGLRTFYPFQREELEHLLVLRDAIRAEMVAAGQVAE